MKYTAKLVLFAAISSIVCNPNTNNITQERKPLFDGLKAPNLNPWTNKQIVCHVIAGTGAVALLMIYLLRHNQTKTPWDLVVRGATGAKYGFTAVASIPYAWVIFTSTVAGIMYLSPFCKKHIERVLRYLWTEYDRIRNAGKGNDREIQITAPMEPLFLSPEITEKLNEIRKSIADDQRGGVYLFVGPSGTGKTEAAVNLAKSLKCPGEIYQANRFNCSGAGFIADSLGEGALDKVKRLATECGHAIFIVNEVEAFQREAKSVDQNTQTGAILNLISACEDWNKVPGNKQITLIMTGNTLTDKIDDAALSRFNYALKFDEMNYERMLMVLRYQIKKQRNCTEAETDQIIQEINKQIPTDVCKDARRMTKIIANALPYKDQHVFTKHVIDGLKQNIAAQKAKAKN